MQKSREKQPDFVSLRMIYRSAKKSPDQAEIDRQSR